VAMPWAMESTRKGRGFIFWGSFVLFHLGVVAGIGLAFVSTIYPSVLQMNPLPLRVLSMAQGMATLPRE